MLLLLFSQLHSLSLIPPLYSFIKWLMFVRVSSQLVKQTTTYNVRSGINFFPPKVSSTKYGLKSLVYKAISDYNQLPNYVRLEKSYVSSKNSVYISSPSVNLRVGSRNHAFCCLLFDINTCNPVLFAFSLYFLY